MLEYRDVWTKPNQQAADWLLNIDEYRRTYAHRQQEFACLSVVTGDGMPHATNPGNPTQRKGMQLADIESSRCWIITIEIVESMLSPKKAAFLQLRREAVLIQSDDPGRPAWISYVQERLISKHGVDLSRRALFDWWRELIELTVRVAIKRECL